ncbi:Nn.00g003140.m01.CDS01 [Neocucurbitaria sp. VM-36]
MREIRQHSSTTIPKMGTQDWWKWYVVATTKATRSQGNWDVQDLHDWIPQLTTLAYPGVLVTSEHVDGLVITEPRIGVEDYALHPELLAQATAFSLTMGDLSLPALGEPSGELLPSVPWTEDRNMDPSLCFEEQARRAAIQYALAN